MNEHEQRDEGNMKKVDKYELAVAKKQMDDENGLLIDLFRQSIRK